jgi:hypothetical protein
MCFLARARQGRVVQNLRMNRLLFGDNLKWLRDTRLFPDAGVDLVYMKAQKPRKRSLLIREKKGVGSPKGHRDTPYAKEKPSEACEKDLQICGAESKSRKRPHSSWAINQMGNPGLHGSRYTAFDGLWLGAVTARALAGFSIAFIVLALAGCAASPPRVARVEFGRSIWTEGQRRAGVLFQDGGVPVPVPGGTLWTFGDTFYGQPQPGQPPQSSQIKGAQSATIAFLPAGRTNLPPALEYLTDSNGVVANPFEYLPDEDLKHHRIWPGNGISLDSRIYLSYCVIEVTDQPGPWNFHGIGAGLAVGETPLGRFVRLRPNGQWRFPVAPAQLFRQGDRLYLLEISEAPKGLILARVNAPEIENPGAYEFFTGKSWSKNRADVKVIFRKAYGQVSVMWVPALGRYLMATSSDFFHPHELQFRQAKQIAGPWSAPARILVPEMPGKKTGLVYCAFFHPELSDEPSLRFVATFCRQLEGNWELSNPEYVTITFKPEANQEP